MKIWYRSILLRGDHCLTWNFHVLNAIKTNQSDKSMAKQHTYVLRKDLYIWYSSDSTDSIYKVYIHVALVFCSFLARICRARHILMMVKEWVWSTFKWNSRQHVNQMKEIYENDVIWFFVKWNCSNFVLDQRVQLQMNTATTQVSSPWRHIYG